LKQAVCEDTSDGNCASREEFGAIPKARNYFLVSSKDLVGGQCSRMARFRKIFTLSDANSLLFQAQVAGKHLTSPGKP